MSKRKQEIAVIIHKDETINRIFDREDLQLFWEEKIDAAIRKSKVEKKDLFRYIMESDREC